MSNGKKKTKKDTQTSENQLNMLKAPETEASRLEKPIEMPKLEMPIEMKKLEQPMERLKLEMKENIPSKKKKRKKIKRTLVN